MSGSARSGLSRNDLRAPGPRIPPRGADSSTVGDAVSSALGGWLDPSAAAGSVLRVVLIHVFRGQRDELRTHERGDWITSQDVLHHRHYPFAELLAEEGNGHVLAPGADGGS